MQKILFAPGFGIILESCPRRAQCERAWYSMYSVIGEFCRRCTEFVYGDTEITMDEALDAWTKNLRKYFPTEQNRMIRSTSIEDCRWKGKYRTVRSRSIYVCKNKVAKPKVFIPVFPGTNCEYDSAKAFERAGAEVQTKVFRT